MFSDSRFSIPWRNLILAVLTIVSLSNSQPSLKSGQRPPIPTNHEPMVTTFAANARMAEDPLGAAMRHWKAANYPVAHQPLEIKADTRILIFITKQGDFSEDVECRIRDRYAVLSAMTVRGYSHCDGRQLPYFLFSKSDAPAPTRFVPIPLSESDAPNPACFVPIAYERMDRYVHGKLEGDSPSAIVVWVPDGLLSQTPVKTLQRIIDRVRQEVPSRHGKCKSLPQVSIVGPRTSSLLKPLLDEKSRDRFRCPVSMYSPFATAADRFLLTEPQPEDQPIRSAIASKLFARNIRFVNCTPTVDVLSDSIIAELKKRLPNENCPPKITMVIEADEIYSRTTPRCIAASMAKYFPTWRNSDEVYEDFVRRVYFYRGLDGETTGKSTDDKSDQYRKYALPPQVEKPQGPQQIDYIRRMALSFASQQEHRPIFGIVASDYDDRLLIVEAIRKSCPGALIFTFSLDAKLVHPANIPFTRNLLVASPFGFSLREDPLQNGQRRLNFQEGIAPFRDSYQTAAFLATQAAILSNPASEIELHLTRQNLSQTRLYEVGLDGLVDISQVEVPVLHPSTNTWTWSTATIGLLAVSVAVILIFFWRFSSVAFLINTNPLVTPSRHDDARNYASLINTHRQKSLKFIFRFAAAAMGLFLLAILVDQTFVHTAYQSSEPIAFLSGISIWPTEFIRVVAIIFGVFALCHIEHVIRSSILDVAVRFDVKEPLLPPPASRKTFFSNLINSVKSYKERVSITSWVTSSGIASARDIWNAFYIRAHVESRTIRIVITAVTFLLVILPFFILWGAPQHPTRGSFSSAIDTITITIAVVLLVLLVSKIIDTVRLFNAAIQHLADHPTTWSDDAVSAFFQRGRFAISSCVKSSDDKYKKDASANPDSAQDSQDAAPNPDSAQQAQDAPADPTSAKQSSPGSAPDPAKPCDPNTVYHKLIDECVMENWIVGDVTERLSRLIYLPAIMLLLLAVSRFRAFDNWDWPPSLLFAFAIYSASILGAMIAMRVTANRSRTEALATLTEMQFATESPASADKHFKEFLGSSIERIKANRSGSFKPLFEDPMFGAILLPFLASGFETLVNQFL